uniref:Uncharacterized protein n=1 Tax=Anguilla anguilla TaxID=7936 RepID=A0A0E9SZT9_ANGAN
MFHASEKKLISQDFLWIHSINCPVVFPLCILSIIYLYDFTC